MVWLQVLNIVLTLVMLGLFLAWGWSLRGVFLTYLERLTTLYGTRDEIGDLAEKVEQVRLAQAAEIGSLNARLDRLPQPVKVRSPREGELLSELWDALLSFQEAALDLLPADGEPDVAAEEGPAGGLAQRRTYERAYRGLSTLLHRRRPFYPASIFQALLRIMTLGDPQSLHGAIEREDTQQETDSPPIPPSPADRIPDVVDEIDQVCELIRTHLMG